MTSLSKHFTLTEFIRSNTAIRLGINNHPDATIMNNLCRLAEFAETLRTELGSVPILVSSGYRCASLNKAVNGAANSTHLQGRAFDFSAPAFGTPFKICHHLENAGLPFDQLIYERTATATWVHIGIHADGSTPRHQVLTIDSKGTREGLWSYIRKWCTCCNLSID